MRTITFLRKAFPDKWTYNRDCGDYSSVGGGRAYWQSKFEPRWEGDDNNFPSYLRVVYPNINHTFSEWEIKKNTLVVKGSDL